MGKSAKKIKVDTPKRLKYWLGLKAWSVRHPYLVAYLIGLIYYGLVVHWMFGLRTAEIAQGLAFVVVAVSAAFIMVSSFALGLPFFVWLYQRLSLSLSGSRWWLIPFVWVIAEYARSIIFSIVALGPGGRAGAYWTFGNVGYWLVHTPLVFAARWGGLYMLSLIVAGLVVGLIRAIMTRRAMPLVIPVVIAVGLSLSGWALYRSSDGPSRTVGVMQFASEFSPEAFSTTTAGKLGEQEAKRYDTLVMPEYSHLWEDAAENDTAAISRVLKDPGGLVIDSVNEKTQDGSLGHNLISYHAADGTPLFTQQKWFSIPGGEYVPYIYQVILAYVGQEQMLLHFQDQKSVNNGENPELPFGFRGVSWGSMACSGVIAPDLYRGITQRGATVLTNSASLDTMGLGMQYHYQARDMAVLHAVANARPFVQSARGGLSYILDKDGKFVSQTSQRGYEFIEGQVQANSVRTFYTRTGDWVVWLSAIIVALAGASLMPGINRHIKSRRK